MKGKFAVTLERRQQTVIYVDAESTQQAVRLAAIRAGANRYVQWWSDQTLPLDVKSVDLVGIQKEGSGELPTDPAAVLAAAN